MLRTDWFCEYVRTLQLLELGHINAQIAGGVLSNSHTMWEMPSLLPVQPRLLMGVRKHDAFSLFVFLRATHEN